MQIIADVRQKAQQFVEQNATTLLTAGGVVGVVGTAVLAWRGGTKFERMIESEYRSRSMNYEDEQAPRLTKVEQVRHAGLNVVPPIATGTITIAAIILSNRMSGQKAAALAAAYGLSQKQLEEYKEKVAEKLGVNKKQKLEDELAQDRVDKTPGSSQIVVVEGEVLCFDQPTGRYFRSTMESINKAVNSTNAEILHHDHASASYFYDELGLPPTTWTKSVGWDTEDLVEITVSTTMSNDDRPCLAIDFVRPPKPDYVVRDY